jgi:hypothetical protein
MKYPITAALLLCATPAAAADPNALHDALLTGDNAAMHAYVEDHYRDAGVSLNPRLEWLALPFDDVVNWYDQYEIKIALAVFPVGPAEVTRYWENWASILTNATWDWRAFFADADEAALMANYNQFVLAAHEYGHALTYRYDWDHTIRNDDSINCREYYADRLSAGLIEEVAEADARLAGLRARYIALMDEINAHVPAESRYETPGFAELDADCRIMNVVQPTAETMTPYASAFFVRQGLLHAQDLPPLATMYESYLFPRLAEQRLPPSGRGGAVTTLEVLANVPIVSTPSVLRFNTRHFSFAPDGSLYVVDISEDSNSKPPRYRFAYGPAGGLVEEVVPVRPLVEIELAEVDLFSLDGAVAMGPDRFLVMSSDSFFDVTRQLLFDVRRSASGPWSVTIHDMDLERVGYFRSRLLTDTTGRLFLYQRRAGAPIDEATVIYEWLRRELDPATLAVIAVDVLPADWLDEPAGIGLAGETYLLDSDDIDVLEPDGQRYGFAGSGLEGLVDSADPFAAEFISPGPLWLDPAGGVRVLDYQGGVVPVIRHIATAAPQPVAAPPPPPARKVRRDW